MTWLLSAKGQIAPGPNYLFLADLRREGDALPLNFAAYSYPCKKQPHLSVKKPGIGWDMTTLPTLAASTRVFLIYRRCVMWNGCGQPPVWQPIRSRRSVC